MKKLHIAIGVDNIEDSVKQYSIEFDALLQEEEIKSIWPDVKYSVNRLDQCFENK